MQEPSHYFRTHEIDGQPLLLVGGNDHKTGHDDPETAFADLEKYTRKHYSVSSVKYRWSSDSKFINVNEDYEVQYWTKELAVSKQELEDAVKPPGLQ
ncbi:hypothetical protein ACVW0P_001439 [Mucilaginibacter sp. UYNi724]